MGRFAELAEKALRGLERMAGSTRRRGLAPTLGVVLVAYDEHETRRSVEAILDRLAPRRGFPDTIIVVVANSEVAHRVASAYSAVTTIRGSNEETEFSGYREGLAELESLAPQAILLVNDRLMMYSEVVLKALDPAVVSLVARTRLAVGQVDGVATPQVLLGRVLKCWIRSNFILVSGSLKDQLIPTRRDVDANRLVPHDWVGERWGEKSDLDARYVQMLTDWLAPAERRDGTWPQAEHLRPEYWPTFRRKVRSIVYEHLLSIRLTESGVPLITARRARVLARLDEDRASATVARLRRLPSGDDLSRSSRLAEALIALGSGLRTGTPRRPL